MRSLSTCLITSCNKVNQLHVDSETGELAGQSAKRDTRARNSNTSAKSESKKILDLALRKRARVSRFGPANPPVLQATYLVAPSCFGGKERETENAVFAR